MTIVFTMIRLAKRTTEFFALKIALDRDLCRCGLCRSRSRCSGCSSRARARPPHTSVRACGRLWNRNSRQLPNCDVCITTSLLSLDTHHHVVLLAELETRSLPSAKVVARVDRAPTMHLGADGPVLLEVSIIAKNRRRVYALLLPDLISRAVGVEIAEIVCAGIVGRIMFTHCEGTILLVMQSYDKTQAVALTRFDHIVLDKRIRGPPVQCEVSPPINLERSCVVEQPVAAGQLRFSSRLNIKFDFESRYELV